MPRTKGPGFTHANLLAVLDYEPATGRFIRKIETAPNAPAGSTANCLGVRGYESVRVLGKQVLAHRLAWFYVTGAWPESHIDHRDGVKHNNAWANLRDVTRSVNLQNRRNATALSTLGTLGVSPKAGRFVAQITLNGQNKHLGYFNTEEAASAAYLAAKRRYHEGCTL